MKRDGYTLMLALLTVLAAVVRALYLQQPMRYDESYSYLFYVRVPLASTLSDYSLPNQHILNSLLMRLSAGLFGAEPWALRLPAFCFGVALVPATFFGLRRLFGAAAALLAAAFVAISPQLILYSTNARGYSLVVLLFVSLLGISTRLHAEDRERDWVWLAVLSVIGLYTIPVMLYAIGGIFIWHGLRAWRLLRAERNPALVRRVVLSALAVVLATLILYAPVLVGTGLGPLIANDWVSSRTPAAFLGELPGALAALVAAWHTGIPWLLVALLVAGVVAYAASSAARRESLGLIACILAWCLVLLLVTMRPPFPRVWLFLLPLYFAVAGRGLLVLSTRLRAVGPLKTSAIAAALVCVAGTVGVLRSDVVTSIEGPRFPDAQAVVTYLATEAKPGDGVYARTPAEAPLWFYTLRAGLPDTMLRLSYGSRQRVLVVVNHAAGQSIGQLRALTPLGSAGYAPPRLLQRFPEAAVYEVRRTL